MSKQSRKANEKTVESKNRSVIPRSVQREDFDPEEVKKWEAILRTPKALEKEGLHMYSPTIAELLNPKQPDVAAAALFQNISLWQKNRYLQTLQDGRRYAFRSLNQLNEDCPYLSRSAADKAIRRMEKKFQKDFVVKRDMSKLWYSISDKLLRTQKTNNLLSFRIEDATIHGNIRTAVLLRNMKYAMNELRDWKRDDNGNKYVRMSPAMLSRILGYSEDTIARCMYDLCEIKNVLSRHPDDALWYTFTNIEDGEAQSLFAQNPFADVHSSAAVVHACTAEVDSASAKVDDSLGTDRTLDRTECVNEDINGNTYVPLTATPEGKRNPPLRPLSEGLMLLEELANDALSKLRAFTPHEQFRNGVTRVTAEQLPYDIVTGDCRNVAELLELNGAELHVDYKPRQLESFEEWVDERVLEMTGNWASVKFPYDQEDVVTLRKFFTLNSGLPDETLLDLWRESDEVVTGDISGNPIKPRKGSFDTRYFARNSRTGRAFLKNLPKIVMQKYFDYEEEITEDEFRRRADREHYLLNYDYLERPPTGSFVPPCFAMLPVVEIDDDDDESCIQFPTMTT